ncbi:energy transducer TonB [Flavobacterium sp. MFBS3-15]|uniref:energy transducer TonB n=1 Tax=Flavobacterium sp. MFBS3-15 TaxID=2989816 RepID=UPI0022361F50|nr:energy transducer TonB [Flavobacterium sp. MFBS3-15]MCW4470458.1 energy transducer TonB [Flavobacterium sp. MFBS3-15]
MSKVNVFDHGWIDLVFEGRNHEYGAYQLRKQDSRTTLLALLSGIGLMAAIVAVPMAINYFRTVPIDIPAVPELPPMTDEVYRVIELPKKADPVIPETPAAAAPAKNTATTKFPPPVASSDPIVETPPKTDDFVNSDPGSITSAGETVGTPLGNPKGTGPAESTGTGTGTETGTGLETLATVDKMPGFPGGMEAFYEQVGRRYRVPELDMSRTFKVYVSFIVETDGTMSDIKVARDPGHGLGAEAIRVLKSIKTKWTPGKKKGKSVRTAYSLPITVNVK